MQKIIKVNSEIPLIGTIMFGLIDRGTNLIQVRPTSLCNLNCPYCSVDSGEKSKTRISVYIIEENHLVNWLRQLSEYKGDNLEANIDSVGEVLTYPDIIKLIQDIKKIKQISKISMQTNGIL
ncbi:MAG: radical SAM protein, partial [Candidatus Woesearchaeota archaeon]|nr:radical SAM protein [Candidatus Woesearchaeota archaeon]